MSCLTTCMSTVCLAVLTWLVIWLSSDLHSPQALALGSICMQTWVVWIHNNTIWINQCAKHFSKVYTLSGAYLIFFFVYLDNILVFNKSVSEHLEHVWTVLQCSHDKKLQAKRPKCHFLHSSLQFLGHIVSGKWWHWTQRRWSLLKSCLP